MSDVSKKKGAREVNNPHYDIRMRNHPSWALNYLEPDMIIQKGDKQIVVDAKYKSHLFNWNKDSENLKETFRHDLHQILAYCSLNGMTQKQAILVYPFSDFICHEVNIYSSVTTSEAKVLIIGIRLDKNKLKDVKAKLNEVISFNN